MPDHPGHQADLEPTARSPPGVSRRLSSIVQAPITAHKSRDRRWGLRLWLPALRDKRASRPATSTLVDSDIAVVPPNRWHDNCQNALPIRAPDCIRVVSEEQGAWLLRVSIRVVQRQPLEEAGSWPARGHGWADGGGYGPEGPRVRQAAAEEALWPARRADRPALALRASA